MKKCTNCSLDKELIEYYSYEKTKSNGEKYIYYQPYCKSCSSEKAIKKRNENREENLAKMRVYGKEYMRNPDRKLKNRESQRKYLKAGKQLEWQRNNKDKLTEYRLERVMHKKHDITEDEWESCKEFFNYSCAYCELPIEEHFVMYDGKSILGDFHKEHFDHDGANDITNCIPSCKCCNSKKHDNSFEGWYNNENEHFTEERLHRICKWIFEEVYSI